MSGVCKTHNKQAETIDPFEELQLGFKYRVPICFLWTGVEPATAIAAASIATAALTRRVFVTDHIKNYN